MSPLRHTIVALFVASTPIASASAQGKTSSRTFAINLISDGNEVPSFVCLVTFMKGKDEKSTRLPPCEETPGSRDPFCPLAQLDGKGGLPARLPIPPGGGQPPQASGCVGEKGSCRPGFDARPTEFSGDMLRHYYHCEENENAASSGRVAILYAGTATGPTDQPVPKKVTLTGTTVSVELMAEPASAVVVHMLGGHYARTDSLTVENGTVKLPLRARCQDQEIELPPHAAEDKVFARLREPNGEVTCETRVGRNRRFSMSLPHTSPSTLKTLEVEAGERGSWGYKRYQGSWTDSAPPPLIPLRSAAVSFAWRRDCMYSSEDCPPARIVGTGVACQGTFVRGEDEPDECRYVCDAGSEKPGGALGALFDLPVRVRYNRPGTDDIWEEELSVAGQELSGFVPPDNRRVDVDFETWGSEEERRDLMTRRAARIRWVAVRGPTGTVHYVVPAPRQRLAVPGARCGDVLSYRVVGEREYEDAFAVVDKGRIRLETPDEQERVYFAGWLVGAGMEIPLTYAARRGQTSFPLAAEPAAVTRFLVGARPAGWAAAFELRASFLLGSQTYFGLADPHAPATERERQTAWWGRIGLEGAAFWMAGSDVHLGVAAGGLFGFPMLRDDAARLGGAQLTFSPGLLVRYLFSPRASLEAAARLIPEAIYVHDSDFQGQSSVSAFEAVPLFLEMGLRFGL